MKTPPIEQIKQMSADTFLTRLAALLKANPAPAADAPMLAQLATIGVIAGQAFDPSTLDPAVAEDLEGVVPVAIETVMRKAREMGRVVNGWQMPPMNLGAFGIDYDTRALITLIALGANLPDDALYPTSFVDGDGDLLDGSSRYLLKFAAGRTPPVNAFWSVTMYDADSFFVENPLRRYAISSWMPLRRNEDGSIDILLQPVSPGTDKESNWLPTPTGNFNVTMRMYWPKQDSPSILDGTWTPPPISKMQ